MERVQKIMEHKDFLNYLKEIEREEENRIFCCHGIQHLLDVARISYIFLLESNVDIKKDIVYATALLHDIGKIEQYRKKIPHEKAGVKLAYPILKSCEYEKDEISLILGAIENHRYGREDEVHKLYESIHRADKWSRNCMYCKVREECNWTENEKNKKLNY
ncbi:MAG: HD domain-containing protein [Lachnospiraceae bacterium]